MPTPYQQMARMLQAMPIRESGKGGREVKDVMVWSAWRRTQWSDVSIRGQAAHPITGNHAFTLRGSQKPMRLLSLELLVLLFIELLLLLLLLLLTTSIGSVSMSHSTAAICKNNHLLN